MLIAQEVQNNMDIHTEHINANDAYILMHQRNRIFFFFFVRTSTVLSLYKLKKWEYYISKKLTCLALTPMWVRYSAKILVDMHSPNETR